MIDRLSNKLVRADKNIGRKAKGSNITLSTSQSEALIDIGDWFNSNESLIYTLSGAAGTGKTFLVKQIMDRVFKPNKVRVGISAPTNKAVRVIERFTGAKGLTIHSLLGLRPNFSLTDFKIDKIKFDSIGTNKFANYDIIVMDEASMIGANLHHLNKIRAMQYNTKIFYVG